MCFAVAQAFNGRLSQAFDNCIINRHGPFPKHLNISIPVPFLFH